MAYFQGQTVNLPEGVYTHDLSHDLPTTPLFQSPQCLAVLRADRHQRAQSLDTSTGAGSCDALEEGAEFGGSVRRKPWLGAENRGRSHDFFGEYHGNTINYNSIPGDISNE